MPIHGSSSIHPPPAVGPQGNTGGVGAIGPAGNLGPSGVTGPTGPTGTYVESSYYKENDLKLYLVLSDGTEIKIKGLFGNTGEMGDAKGKTSENGFPILKEVVAGETFEFKGFTAEGSLIVYGDANVLGISGDKRFSEGSTAESLSEYRFLYLSTKSTADVSGLTYDYQDQSMVFGHGRTGNRWTYSPEEIIISVPPVEYNETVNIYGTEEWTSGPQAGQGVGIQLAVTSGSVFDVETPIGIAGFTGDFRENETFKFTMMVKGNSIWEWPDNVYFDPRDRFFSCGTDIIALSSNNSGKSWTGVFTARGYEVNDCESVYGLGSCCWIGDDQQQKCDDLISESDCSLKNQSYWNPLSTCEDNCGQTNQGVCCSEGGDWWGEGTSLCLEGIGPAQCDYFGGSYWTEYYYQLDEYLRPVLMNEPRSIQCEIQPPNCSVYDACDWCLDPCVEPFTCCKDGQCVGDSLGSTSVGPISPAICVYVFGGTPIYDAGRNRSADRDWGNPDCYGNDGFDTCRNPVSGPFCPPIDEKNTDFLCMSKIFNNYSNISGWPIPDEYKDWYLSNRNTCFVATSCTSCGHLDGNRPDDYPGHSTTWGSVSCLEGVSQNFDGCDTFDSNGDPTWKPRNRYGNECDGWRNPTEGSDGYLGACCRGPLETCIETTRCECENEGGNWIGGRRCKPATAYVHGLTYRGEDVDDWRYENIPGSCHLGYDDELNEWVLSPDVDCGRGACLSSASSSGNSCRHAGDGSGAAEGCCTEVTGPEACSGEYQSWQGFGSNCYKCGNQQSIGNDTGPDAAIFDYGTCYDMQNPPWKITTEFPDGACQDVVNETNQGLWTPLEKTRYCNDVCIESTIYDCIGNPGSDGNGYGGKFRRLTVGEVGAQGRFECPNDCSSNFVTTTTTTTSPIVGGGCGTIDCCDHITHVGACCIPGDDPNEGECTVTTNFNCIGAGGIFMGPETECQGPDAVNCCFDLIGWCCQEDLDGGNQGGGQNDFRRSPAPSGTCVPSYQIDCSGQWFTGDNAFSNCQNYCVTTTTTTTTTGPPAPTTTTTEEPTTTTTTTQDPSGTTTTGPPPPTTPDPDGGEEGGGEEGGGEEGGGGGGPGGGGNIEPWPGGGGGGGGGYQDCPEAQYCVRWGMAESGSSCEDGVPTGPDGGTSRQVSCARCVTHTADLSKLNGLPVFWNSGPRNPCPGWNNPDDNPPDGDYNPNHPACGGGEYQIVSGCGVGGQLGSCHCTGEDFPDLDNEHGIGDPSLPVSRCGTDGECFGKYHGAQGDNPSTEPFESPGAPWIPAGEGCCTSDFGLAPGQCPTCDYSRDCDDCGGDPLCTGIGGDPGRDDPYCGPPDSIVIEDIEDHESCRDMCPVPNTCNDPSAFKECMKRCRACKAGDATACNDDQNPGEFKDWCDTTTTTTVPPMPLPARYVKLPDGSCAWLQNSSLPDC